MKNIIIAITGASGQIYAQRLIDKLQIPEIAEQINDINIIFSENGKKVWQHEIGYNLATSYNQLKNDDLFCSCASGSSNFDTMIICPCSMGTLSKIASGISDNLICRSADVFLKERKNLILVVRETPLNIIHIENMQKLTIAGAVILPASPSFYSNPQNINEVIDTVVDRIIKITGIYHNHYIWGNNSEK